MAPGAGEVTVGTQGYAPRPSKPPWLLPSFQPAPCHQALRNLLSSSADASCFLAVATLLRLPLKGWPSLLDLDGQQLSTCKWESERLLSPCEASLQMPTAWTPRCYSASHCAHGFSPAEEWLGPGKAGLSELRWGWPPL